MTERLKWIDALKGISIILVVYFHVILMGYNVPFESGVFNKTIFDRVNFFIAYNLVPLRMPLFFLISGFLASRSVLVKSWGQTFHSKIGVNIYIIAIWLVILNISFLLINERSIDILTMAKLYNTIEKEEITRAVSLGRSTLWYLYALVIFFTVTKIFRNKVLPLLAFALLLNTVSLIEGWKYDLGHMSFCYLFFVGGVFWGKLIFHKIEALRWRDNLFIFTVGIVILLITKFTDLRYKTFESIFSIYILTLIVIKLFSFGFEFRVLSYIGRNTLPIYIIHRPIIEFSAVFIVPWIISLPTASGREHAVYSLFFPIALTLMCTFFALFIWKMTNKSLGKYLYGYEVVKNQA